MPGSSVPLMAGGQPIREAVADQAAQWLTLLMSGEANDDDRQRWQHWCNADPDHARAWSHIEAVTGRLKGVNPHAGYQALSAYTEPPSASRRHMLRMLLWGGIVGVAGVAGTRTPTWRHVIADHRTSTGEQRTIDLPDGTRIVLNTGSGIDVHFDSTRRLLRLVVGEVFVITAHTLGHGGPDPRPLIVETAEGRIRALGTRFNVRQLPQQTDIAVRQSAVELAPMEGGTARILREGERAVMTRTAIGAAQTIGPHDDAWTRGQIVAEDMALGAFVDELSRYRPGVLRCDPAVAGLRLSGVFPLHDTDRILALLPQVLPVAISMRTRYWATIQPAS